MLDFVVVSGDTRIENVARMINNVIFKINEGIKRVENIHQNFNSVF